MSNESYIRRLADRRGMTNFFATTLSCALVAGAMLLHAWARTRVTEQGYVLSRLSADYRDLTREHERLQIQAAELRSPQRIEELARTQLSMSAPSMDRVVVLVGEETGFARRRAQAAGRSMGGAVKEPLIASVR
jgi:cell division protein FtsL